MTAAQPAGGEGNPPIGDPATLPSLFRAADAAASRGQRDFLALTAIGLGALVLAAGAGVLTFPPFNLDEQTAAIIAAIGFVCAIMVRSYALAARPEGAWYDGRALAESTKTLAWRYAVGADPFPIATDNADELFAERLRDILNEVRDLAIALEPDLCSDEITPEMRLLRSRSLEERRLVYHNQRIDDQRHWYGSRSRAHGGRARRLGYFTLAAESVGAALAVMKAGGVVTMDFLPLSAAFASGLIGWERARQDSVLAQAYGIASQEFATISSLIHLQTTEEQWSAFVGQAEEAISREHTLWRASRSRST